MAMRMLRAVALCALTLSPWAHAADQSSSTKHSVAFYPDAESPPLLSLVSAEEKMAPALDRAWIWRRYESHLLSKTRSAAFIVLFTSGNDCDSIAEDDEDEEEPVAEMEIQRRVQDCLQQRDQVEKVINVTRKELSQRRGAVPTNHCPTSPGSCCPTLSNTTACRHRCRCCGCRLVPPTSSSGTLIHRPTSSTWLQVPPATLTSLTRSPRSSTAVAKQGAAFAKKAPLSMEGSTAETVIQALPFIGIGLYLVVLAIEHRAAVLKVLQSRVTWLVITEGIVYVSLSGLFHSIIHKMPPFVAHPQHGLYLIHPSGRKQFFLEGLVNGSWSFWISFGLFSIVDILPKLRSPYARDELFQYALLGIGIAYILLHLVFSAKHRWLSR